jgi:hypothetical protein
MQGCRALEVAIVFLRARHNKLPSAILAADQAVMEHLRGFLTNPFVMSRITLDGFSIASSFKGEQLLDPVRAQG